MKQDKVRVAIGQFGSSLFENDVTLEKVESYTKRAAEQGAQLVLFPEALVGGYLRGSQVGCYMGGRTPEGRRLFAKYHEHAIAVPGEETERLGAIAREASIYMVIGVIEKDGGTLYCTVLFFDPAGTLLGKHRKLMPTGQERVVWGFGDGSTLPVFDTPLGKLGAVICWENYMPLLRMTMYGKGIQIYCAPTADERETWHASMRHIAAEGRCFVLSANQYYRLEDQPPGLNTEFQDAPNGVVARGGSCVIDPFGNYVSTPVFDEEALIVADLDMTLIPMGKYDFDVVGHYSRPDIFHLEVDERHKAPITTVR
jgi:nitrilase